MSHQISLLRQRDVLSRTGLKRSTFYRLIADKKFPKPVKLSQRCCAWPSDAIDRWIAEKIEQAR